MDESYVKSREIFPADVNESTLPIISSKVMSPADVLHFNDPLHDTALIFPPYVLRSISPSILFRFMPPPEVFKVTFAEITSAWIFPPEVRQDISSPVICSSSMDPPLVWASMLPFKSLKRMLPPSVDVINCH